MRTCAKNPEREQDRVADLFELFNKSGVAMFHQQRRIYAELAKMVAGCDVYEAGCGTGQGTAMLARAAGLIRATDKSARAVQFARQLYPWIDFSQWDATQPVPGLYEAVVSVEMLEHVDDGPAVVRNLVLATTRTAWISTPNGNGKSCPPDNPFHVREYLPLEVLNMVHDADPVAAVTIFGWDDLRTPLHHETDVDPLVYRVRRRAQL